LGIGIGVSEMVIANQKNKFWSKILPFGFAGFKWKCVQTFDSYEKMLKISNARPYYTYIPLYLRTDCDRVYVTNRDFF